MLFMVVEHFQTRDPLPINRRFRELGRMAPGGLTYVSSWVDDRFERCFQLMATDDQQLLDRWIENWSDVVEFEIYPVSTSKGVADQTIPTACAGADAFCLTARTTPVDGTTQS